MREGGRFTKALPDFMSREMFCSAFGWAQKRPSGTPSWKETQADSQLKGCEGKAVL